ncbi:MAG: methylated-DNA--[protein]-cysteine S-methyltransferase [Muribaculaceae bacterium]|nr:methylated-DNA--[protein]-cysteine S-methyltransferase [Muribaculaceae bacterium]
MKSDRYVITSTCQTPCGELILGSIDGKLCLCDWTKSRHRRTVDNRIQKMLVARYMQGSTPVIEEAKKQIAEYFDGRRREFDLPVNLTGTGFQQRVWEYISRIPYGTTRSYAALTSEVASESDIRAVSNAVGANSLSIIIPCHRVIGSRGQLTGYAGGLVAKQYLIDFEKTLIALENADSPESMERARADREALLSAD